MPTTIRIAKIMNITLSQNGKYRCHEIVNPILPVIPAYTRSTMIMKIETPPIVFELVTSPSLDQERNSLHGKPKRIASFEPDPESIVRDPHLLQRKLSFSLLLSKMKNYYSFIALKYGKVRIFINGSGMTW